MTERRQPGADPDARPMWAWLVPLLVVLVVLGYFLVRHRTHRAEFPVAAFPVVTPQLPFLGTVKFEHNRSTLTPQGKQTLDQAADALRVDPTIRMRIEGMAPSTGSPARNASLESRRALAVQNYLETLGIGRGQLTGSGFGPPNPQDSEAAKLERADGPRVELFSQQ